MSFDIDVLGAAVAAPGLADWATFQAVLAGAPIDPEQPAVQSTLLSARDRRRAPAAVRLNFAAAEQACAAAGLAPGDPVAVFSSAMGDVEISDYICRTLAEQPDQLSPTRFHNSVHNAASGYWSIGTSATGDVTAVSGGRDSVTAGWIEALARAVGDDTGCDSGYERPVLLVVFDDRGYGPMRDLWPSVHPFCSALVLARPGARTPIARLEATLEPCSDAGPTLPEVLAERVADNPSARMLPALALIAGFGDGPVSLGAEQGPGVTLRLRARTTQR